jgi:ATP-dependent exoDNAse (exonuclease V) alpha subunit
MIRLTADQTAAVDAVLAAYRSGVPVFSLSGGPGTGKTYTTGEVVRQMRRINLNIAVAASTNKAVDVIRNAAIEGGWFHHVDWWGTVHRLLGLVVDEQNPGHLVRLGINRTRHFGAVVVDESSMLGEDIVSQLREHARFVLFVGDRNQLPPVGEELPTAFIGNGSQLSESMRHESGGDILKLVQYVENAINGDLDRIPKTLLEPFAVRDLQQWQDGIGMGSSEVALAFTNAEVGRINRVLRANMHKKQEYEEGDRVVFTGPFYRNRELLFATSELAFVQEAARTVNKHYPVWSLHLAGRQCGFVQVLNTEGENNCYTQWLKDEGYPLPQLARLTYGYALTVHRSQGSEFDTVHVNLEDIRRCQELEQRRKLAYVAFSRARKRLRVFTRR